MEEYLYLRQEDAMEPGTEAQRFAFLEALNQAGCARSLLAGLGMPGNGPYCLVGLFPRLPEGADPAAEARRILEAAGPGLLEGRLGLAAWTGGSLTAFLVCGEGDSTAEAAQTVCQSLAAALPYPVCGVLSRRRTEPSQLPEAFTELREANAYAQFMATPSGTLLGAKATQPQAEADAMEDGAFYQVMTGRIATAIATGDGALLRELTAVCEKRILCSLPRVSAVHVSAIHFAKPLEAILITENIIDKGYLGSYQLVRRLMETQNAQALRQALQKAMEDLMAHARVRRQGRYAETMVEIMEYLIGDLSNPELSVTSVAARFELPPSTLSVNFKAFYAASIPDVIHRARVSRIKEGLTATRKSAKQLALENGYVSVATMNRAFLRLEGVYPGQFRKQARQEPSD